MRIQLLHSEGCHTWEKTLELLNQILREKGVDEEVETVKIATQEEADKYRYFGSPQVNLNGKDIDPMAEKVTNFKPAGCRFYLYGGKTYEFPPREMLEEAIDKGRES
jgi:hypothetical protein